MCEIEYSTFLKRVTVLVNPYAKGKNLFQDHMMFLH